MCVSPYALIRCKVLDTGVIMAGLRGKLTSSSQQTVTVRQFNLHNEPIITHYFSQRSLYVMEAMLHSDIPDISSMLVEARSDLNQLASTASHAPLRSKANKVISKSFCRANVDYLHWTQLLHQLSASRCPIARTTTLPAAENELLSLGAEASSHGVHIYCIILHGIILCVFNPSFIPYRSLRSVAYLLGCKSLVPLHHQLLINHTLLIPLTPAQ